MWEIVFSTYLLVSLYASQFKSLSDNSANHTNSTEKNSSHLAETTAEFSQHSWWEAGTNWKSALNNLRLIIQPYIFWCLIAPWLSVFQITGLKRGFSNLIEIMNNYRGSPTEYALAN